MKKDDRLYIRCTNEEKQELKRYLNMLNKKTDFIIRFFLDSMRETTPEGLKIQKYILERELEAKEKENEKLKYETEDLKIKIKAVDDNIKNKSLYDISNYEHNEKVLKAIGDLKAYYENKKHLIGSVEDIPQNVFITIAGTRGINYKDLIEIAKTDFKNWNNEIN